MYQLRRTCLTLMVACAAAQGNIAAETWDSLARRLPASANALALIDVEQTLAAPLAVEQGWAGKLDVANVERPMMLPPEAKKVALSAALQPNHDFAAAWEVAVVELAEPISVRSIARSEAGYVDQINGLPAAVVPQDAAFMELSPEVLAVVQPAERQFLSRFSAHANANPELELSEYLKSSLQLVNDRVQILLAVDLTDVAAPRDIDAALAKATWLADAKVDARTVADIVGTLRGAALRIAVGTECQAQLQIDFAAEAAPLAAAAKPLVLQALENVGFPTDEISKWKLSLIGRSIRMQGVLSPTAQRRVMSIMELPAVELKGKEAAGGGPEQTDASDVRERSLAYFKSTQTLVDDLRKGLKDACRRAVA